MRLPSWLKTNSHRGLHRTRSLLRTHGVSTVCEEARCPNKGHCFARPTAAFMILGDRCTRNCSFCSVIHGMPSPPDPNEPSRIAGAARQMGLSYIVITSVTRDDLEDGGAGHFAATINKLKHGLSGAKIEVLTPDFKGKVELITRVLDAGPDAFNHNMETVPRLYPEVRPQADYRRSLSVLKTAAEYSGKTLTKSGLMVGLGEKYEEVLHVMEDLRTAGCDMLTIGQYLRPRKENLPVKEYVHPEVFERYAADARRLGFRFVASAPLVRSSMNAGELFQSTRGDSIRKAL